MPPTYEFRDPDGVFTDITDYFRLYTLDVTMNAEEGSVGVSTITADDPTGAFDIVGHRQVRIREDTATGSNTLIYAGYTAERVIKRGDYHRVSTARVWDISLTDINTILARRIFDRDSANRPAETDVARMSWLMGREESSLIDDVRYLSLVNPVNMDAVDYRGQTVADLIDDCAQQSGKNWFVWYADDLDYFSMWYDFSASSNYSSPLRLSNVLSDVDDEWTFAISADATLRRDPSRVYSGVYLPYDGGFVYSQNETTAEAFARRDAAMPAINVKTATKALARTSRYLSSISTEEDTITATVVLPAAKVNLLMQGMRVQLKASHLPDFEAFTWMRCISRNVRQESEEFYEVTVELIGNTPAGSPTTCANLTATGSFYPLGGSGNTPNVSTTGNVLYLRPGISQPTTVTANHQGSWHFPSYGAGGAATVDYAGDCVQNRVRCMVVGNGTMVIHTATYSGSPRNLQATLYHADAGSPSEYVIDEVQTGTTGDDFTFTVSTHNDVNCTHWVDLRDNDPTCGGKFGFSGFDWTAA